MTDQHDVPVPSEPKFEDPGVHENNLGVGVEVPARLGQAVTFTWSLTRRTVHNPGRGYGVVAKKWVTGRYPGQPTPEPTTGILIGVRTLSNGENHYHGFEDGIEYRQKETFKAYLVAHDLRRKPVLVLPEQLTMPGQPLPGRSTSGPSSGARTHE